MTTGDILKEHYAKKTGVVFCKTCNNMLNYSNGYSNIVECYFCHSETSTSEFQKHRMVTTKEYDLSRTKNNERREKGHQEFATVKEKCPKCGHHELRFYTMQLRSADEGQTVFYNCPVCSHKFSTNT
eukprot:GEZU01009831.1.p1 GENE.GEZU01009831.1~~GEZU01009831.1.p1  ORF type:complete len:127 (-),score=20.22 GEZU01009831.1:175-555(-)